MREVLEGLAARRAACHISDKQIARLGKFFSAFPTSKKITDFKTYSMEDRSFHNFVTDVGDKEFLKSILQTYNIISFSYQALLAKHLVHIPDRRHSGPESAGDSLHLQPVFRTKDAPADVNR